MPARLLKAKIGQCRFIPGEPTANAIICGEPVQADSSYCPEHHALCHRGLAGVRPSSLRDGYTTEIEYRDEDPTELEFAA